MAGDDGARETTDELAVRAAWLYYVDGLTQAQVAERLYVSRPTVGRLLDRARSAGAVRIEIATEHLGSFRLAREIQDRYGLRDVLVVPSSGDGLPFAERNARLAVAGATYLGRFLHPGAVVGVAWGDTVQHTLTQLPESVLDGVTFTALTGGIDYISKRVLASPSLAGRLRGIPAPLIVSTASVATLLRQEAPVKDVLALGGQASIAITSIGAAVTDGSAVNSGIATVDEVERWAAAGAVGDMLGEWIDADGAIVDATSDRRIGIPLDELRSIDHVIGIAGGRQKVAAIAGALAGGYFDVLITDEEAADGLLAMPTRPHAAHPSHEAATVEPAAES